MGVHCVRFWQLGAGCWVLGAGCWVLGAECWVLGWVLLVNPNMKYQMETDDVFTTPTSVNSWVLVH